MGLDWDKRQRSARKQRQGTTYCQSLRTLPGDPIAAEDAQEADRRRQLRAGYASIDPALRKQLNQQYRQHRLHLEAIGATCPDYREWVTEQASQQAQGARP